MATDPLSLTFSALADPTRRAILARLTEGAATVKELAAPFAMSGPAVSKHLRVLERAGLIYARPRGPVASLHAEAAPLEGSRRVGGGLSALLGRELRAVRRVPRTAQGREQPDGSDD